MVKEKWEIWQFGGKIACFVQQWCWALFKSEFKLTRYEISHLANYSISFYTYFITLY